MGAWKKLNSEPRSRTSAQWHHTVDKLPMFREEVLVYRKDKRVTTAYLELSDEGQVRWVDLPYAEDRRHYFDLREISHWLEFDGKPMVVFEGKLDYVRDALRYEMGWVKDDSEEK
ncbi:MAG: hypothetical protein EBR82_19325 [Caulobacteraceae bacterium]|nr:hypothetical protein [Caulobacteraceae bacterium]